MIDSEFYDKVDKGARRASQLLVLFILTAIVVSECKRNGDYKQVIYNYEDISKGKTELMEENKRMIGEPHRDYYSRSPRYIHFWDKYNYRKEEDND